MAGTPTPNYSFPTYAETDVPDLAGAYNQAVNAIDAKIKEVADTIPSDVDVPDANSTTKGIAKLYDSTSIGDSTQEDGGVTPAAMKGYVDEKVPTEQQAYTGTTPIVVDNGSHAISIKRARLLDDAIIDDFMEDCDNASFTGSCPAVANSTKSIDKLMTGTLEQGYPQGKTVPSVYGMAKYVESRTPDASTTAKGLVQLTNTLEIGETNKALTGESLNFAGGIYNEASRPLTVTDLSRLKVNTSTGLVYLDILKSD